MFNLAHLITAPFGYYDYIWIDVLLIKETKKAILIMFDNKEAWLPKAWILKTKFPLPEGERARVRGHAIPIKIKISQYHWAKKFS